MKTRAIALGLMVALAGCAGAPGKPAADLATLQAVCKAWGPGLDLAASALAPKSVRDIAVYPRAFCADIMLGSVAAADEHSAGWLSTVLALMLAAAKIAGFVLPLIL